MYSYGMTPLLFRKDGSPIPHGKYSTYTNHGCRCPECKSAAKEKRRSQRALRTSLDFQSGSKANHNTRARYMAGCRCALCRAAVVAYARSQGWPVNVAADDPSDVL